MNEIVPVVLLLLLISGYFIYYLRGRPRPSDISSLSELKERFGDSRFTIVQFYAPL